MLKSVFRTTQFKKDFKALLKKHYNPDKLRQAIDTLMAQDKQLLSTKYRDHQLTGSWRGYREIHIEGDWLVIYRVEKQELQLVLTRTGSHDDLFLNICSFQGHCYCRRRPIALFDDYCGSRPPLLRIKATGC